MDQSQALTLLAQRIRELSIGSVSERPVRDVSGEYAELCDPEQVRCEILDQINHATARGTLPDGTLLINSAFGRWLTIRKDPSNGHLVRITGSTSGTEDFDGEDSGMFTFWMNKTSVEFFRNRIEVTPVVGAKEMLKRLNLHSKG